MPRRAGKAASRRARQRPPRRPVVPGPPPESTAVPPIGTPDAREAASLTPPRRTVDSGTAAAHGSTLSDRERAQYHYVERDLRNIWILSAAMAVLLFLSWLAFSSLGLVG